MSPHPCADHLCDGCYVCRMGTCCMTVSAEERTRLEVEDRVQHTWLHDAIVLEVGTIPSLYGLVRLDVERERSARPLRASRPLGLPKPAAKPPLPKSGKEAVRDAEEIPVVAARPPQ